MISDDNNDNKHRLIVSFVEQQGKTKIIGESVGKSDVFEVLTKLGQFQGVMGGGWGWSW